MKDRIELFKKNRKLIVDTLEHIQNVTNIGIKITENAYNISIKLPNELISKAQKDSYTSLIKYGAQLIFSQDPQDGIKIKHKMPQVRYPDEPIKAEIVYSIPASALNRELIFTNVIEFLERVQGEISFTQKNQKSKKSE